MEPLRYHQRASVEYGPDYNGIRSAQPKARAVPHSAHVAIRVFSLTTAVSIIGILGHASVVWFSTRNVVQQQSNGIRQRAWPAHMDLWPTWVMLATAVIAVLIQIVSLLTLFGPVRRLRESHLHNWTVFFSSVLAIAAWVAAVVYFKLQDTKGKKDWDLWSWSCTHKSLDNSKMSFETMCVEMNYTFYASVVVGALEIASLAIFGLILHNFHRDYSRITVVKI